MENYITASCRIPYLNSYNLASKHVFFANNEYVVIDVIEDSIIVKRPSIDYNGKQYKPTFLNKSNIFTLSYKSELLSNNRYYIDNEESNEDIAIFRLSNEK